jgi:hypothetical protein
LTINGGGILRGAADGAAPAITISQPADGSETSAPAVEVSGFFNDQSEVSITVDGAQATTSGNTDWKAFGVRLDGTPGHPYAKFDWNASAGFDGSSVSANYSGTLTVEFEKVGGGFDQESFSIGSGTLSSNGEVTVGGGSHGNFKFDLR